MARNFEKIKAELLIRKKELEELFKDLSQDSGSDTDVKDLGDQVSALANANLRQSLEDTELKEYQGILNALKAIDNNTYGNCIDCGQEISDQRLKYNPDAQRCIRCQEMAEF